MIRFFYANKPLSPPTKSIRHHRLPTTETYFRYWLRRWFCWACYPSYIDQSIRLDGIDKTATKSPLLSSDYQLFTKIDFRSLEATDLPQYDLVLLLETLQSVNKREGKKLLTQLLQQNNSLLISVDRSQWDKGDFAELSNALFLFDSERTLVFLTKDPEKIKRLRKNRITSKLLRGIGSSKTATRIIKRVTKTKSK